MDKQTVYLCTSLDSASSCTFQRSCTQNVHHLTCSSSLPSFCTSGSESICISSTSPVCFSIKEAPDTLKMPWMFTRTLTFTLELSPSGWGATFWTEKHPGGRHRIYSQLKKIHTHPLASISIFSLQRIYEMVAFFFFFYYKAYIVSNLVKIT